MKEDSKEELRSSLDDLLGYDLPDEVPGLDEEHELAPIKKERPLPEESKAKITEGRDYSKYKTKEFRDKISKLNKGSNNPMYGKSFYDVWLKKYGKEVADQKMTEYRQKQSELNSGENNNMYGKPSPNGSGNGWSGWYNGWFFRSIRELSYMIKVIERYNLKWESGETNKWKIQYKDYDGLIRNYFPDFIIKSKDF